jgi:hypothetical protein
MRRWSIFRLKGFPAAGRRWFLAPPMLFLAAAVVACLMGWCAWLIRSNRSERVAMPFFLFAVWIVSSLLTGILAKTWHARSDNPMSQSRLRFNTRNLLLSIGCFAIAISGATYAIKLSPEDSIFFIALLPTSGIGIGGGVGALFSRLRRGIMLGLLFQACQLPAAYFCFVLLAIFVW